MSRAGRPAPSGRRADLLPFPDLAESIRSDPAAASRRVAADVERTVAREGPRAALNRLSRLEVSLGLRRPTLAVYDHAFHLIGGAQRYGATLAAALRDRFDVTLISNKPLTLDDIRAWYGLDLAGCRVEVLPIPFYESRGTTFLDPALLTPETGNPFRAMSVASSRFDVFVNNGMNDAVEPLALRSVMICHFPERKPRYYFYADRYDRIVFNSRYTEYWIGRNWRIRGTDLVYPPVEAGAPGPDAAKQRIILSVARFEPEGTKRQAEMIQAFLQARAMVPRLFDSWTLVLAGGSEPTNRYLDRLRGMIAGAAAGGVELKVNICAGELQALYHAAPVFWHMCGLNHRDPAEVEHFGMTTVEAMRSRAVPIVYDAGGLREIVEDGVDGFRVGTKAQLLEATARLIRDPAERLRLAAAAEIKAGEFSRDRFDAGIRRVFDEILTELQTVP